MQVRYSLVKPQLPEFICTDEPICAISPFKPSGKEGGGGGVLNKCLYGKAPPPDPTLYLFLHQFPRRGIPFVYLLLTNGTPFTYLV